MKFNGLVKHVYPSYPHIHKCITIKIQTRACKIRKRMNIHVKGFIDIVILQIIDV